MPSIAAAQFFTNTFKSRVLSRFRKIGAAGGGALGLLILLGYAIDFPPAWRLADRLPATHPLTALCLALLGFGLLDSLSPRLALRLAARAAVVAAAGIVMLRLLAPWIGTALFDAITPFGRIMAAEAATATPITMAPNSVYTLLALAVADMLRWRRWWFASQVAACYAAWVLLIALIGYIDGLHNFRGGLAPLTLLGAMMLALASLCATHHDGFVRPVVAPSAPGRLARVLLGWSTPLILLIGWAVARDTSFDGISQSAKAVLAYQTAAIIMLSWILVTASTLRADVIDRHRRQAELSLINAASTDALTGLLSRNQLELCRRAGETNRPGMSTAELFIDLDRFRAVNEAFGHAVGDQFLTEIGRRLQSVGGAHEVGRLGGDEFAIYCTDISDAEAEQLGHAVTLVLAVPFDVAGRSFRLTASVGVSHSDPARPVDLRAAADTAMHVAKRRGGNQVVAFDSSMHAERRSQSELEQHLYDALEQDDQLWLAYQPVVRLSDGALIAVEALARWSHPELGAIAPDKFIRVAETTGLIVPLGLKLMANAVAQAASWRDLNGADAPRINLNISPLQFAGGDVIADLEHMLDRHTLSTAAICIEVTEGAFSDAQAIRLLERARAIGFKVAMDDFGVGYSSLSQLPRLPVTTVKLDRSFIVNSTKSAGGATLLTSIVQLAHGLELTVVAEGVETPEQLELVTRVGCDSVQGYIYARPMRPEDFQAWVAERAGTPGLLSAAVG